MESNTAAGVYFVVTADERFVKIGFSEHILERFLQVRTIGPGTADARLLGYIPGGRATEDWLHRTFQAHRDVGEWFQYTTEIRDFATRYLIPLADFSRKPQKLEGDVSKVMRQMSMRRRSFGGPPRKAFTCRYCGQSVMGRRQLQAHQGDCSMRPASLGGRPPKPAQCHRCKAVFQSVTKRQAHKCPGFQNEEQTQEDAVRTGLAKD